VLGPIARRLSPARAAAGAVALLLTTAVALAGCGGSGSSAPTKAEWIQKIDLICSTEKQEITQLAVSRTTLLASASLDNKVREGAATKIEAVKLPGSEAISPEWMKLRRRAIAAANTVAAIGLKGPKLRGESEVFRISSNQAATTALAYGLHDCRGFAAS
jgi:hypothetical protein